MIEYVKWVSEMKLTRCLKGPRMVGYKREGGIGTLSPTSPTYDLSHPPDTKPTL